MKKVLFMAMVCVLASCSSQKPNYSNVDEYPVRKDKLEEMVYSPEKTAFALWSPAAEAVYVNIYADQETTEATERLPMQWQKDGTWRLTVEKDLKDMYYTFSVTQPGSAFPLHETPGIFCKAVSINGLRAAIIDLDETDPEGWEADKRPDFRAPQDAVIYEMHHRDMTIHPSAGVAHPGKFLAMTEEGTTSPQGLPTGIDHLKELGVTHVQILPSYDFGSIDEAGATGEAKVLESGAAAGGSYNWGYDPVNYNVPEGSYSTDPRDPKSRIIEMKKMIQALHKAGIRVIMDVVYNHTYDLANSQFEQTCPGYFYRLDEEGNWGNASGCGNETASQRPMMRKFILESVRYWVEEYHVDGFRFDLMGIHDYETMNAVRKELDKIDKSLLLYGEGWAAGAPNYPAELMAMKANISKMPGIGAFCDDMRDGLRGPWSDDREGAMIAGWPDYEESVKFGIVGAIYHPQVAMDKVNYDDEPWATEPTQCISYVSCHDDMMLSDRLKVTMRDEDGKPGEKAELIRLDKLAQTAVLTSQGIPFLWCGEEVMRDKKGVHNSFCSPDSINAIDWNLKAENIDLFNYYKGMIALRKQHPAFRMGDADAVREHLHFLEATDANGSQLGNVVAWELTDFAGGDEWETIIVVLNASKQMAEVALPEGTFTAVVYDGQVNLSGTLTMSEKAHVLPQSALILHN